MYKTISLVLILVSAQFIFAQQYELNSPNKNIKLDISIEKLAKWKLFYKDKLIITDGEIALNVNGIAFPENKAKVYKANKQNLSEEITSSVPVKFRKLKVDYNSLTLVFKNKNTIEFRMYNDGFAYRLATNSKKDIEINDEIVNFSFPKGTNVFFPEEISMISHYERVYQDTLLSGIETGKFASLPVLFQTTNNVNILFTEADLYDYPGLFIEKSNTLSLKSKFPNVITEIRTKSDRNETIVKEANHIAQTSGKRTFPWRVFTVTGEDKDLLKSQMVYNLSRKNITENFDWIKPGKVAWDWLNALNITGVDFKSGINNETYKYFIDFASEYGLEYIILDEGWSKTTTNLLETNPDIDMPELMAYAKQKNVGIILWVLWKPLDKNMEKVLEQFVAWGAKGIKVDFMQRADQEMVNFYLRTAKEAAKHKLLVDFHGSFKPSGLRASYPNVLSYEGLKGLENAKWSKLITPKHDLTLPFTRMVAGPMDYTPGAMINAHEKNYMIRWERPMSMGTRAHQIAMYVVYESPLQMLADNPTNYKKESESTTFISKIPTTWDETLPLDAKVARYLLIARRNANNWYVAAMTDDNPRELEVDFSFLPEGDFQMELIRDGINADMNAEDYKLETLKINNQSKLKIKLASGGGWAGILVPVN
ncbi:MAG: glycoside hydrolase family 97 protein [Bacteroidetes bacterium]|nr:MAG: glycoside hydrolase family 97 protein [Bacteroidota bacterium]